jgi:energy-coupling factor transport system permease protein
MTHALLHTLAGRTLLAYLAVFVVPVVLPAAFVKLVGLGGLRSVFAYEAADGPIHRIDPRIKLLYPFIFSSMSVLLSWQAVFVLVGISIIPWMILRPSRARVRTLLTLALSPTVGVIWSQALFHPAVSASGAPIVNWPFPPTISWIGTSGISLPGLVYGAEQSGRLLVSVSASLLLVVTTSPSDMVWAFRKFRLPAKAGFAVSVALRFLPDFFTRMSVLLRAVEVRGLDLSRPRWWTPWKVPAFLGRVLIAVPTVTVPLLIGALRSASTMAMVADARAFGVVPTPTTFKEHTTTRADMVAGIGLGAVVALTVALVVTGVGARA